MALGAIVNANNAFLPPDFNPTLNHRFVYRPYFGMVDTEKKTGKLTLTYATQIHACVVEVDRETGVVEIVDYAAVDDCGTRIHPQIVEGQVHGATVHAIGAALYEDFVYDEDGQLLTSNFYDYHVPHALDVPSLKTGAIESPSPFSPLGSKGMGEGGGGGIHCICSAIQDALKPAGAPIVYDSCNPYHRVWSMLQDPESTRANVTVVAGVKVEGTKELTAPREVVWQVLNDPAQMAKLMPGVEGFEIKDDRHWQAKVKIPLGLGGLRMTIDFEKVEEREPEFAQLNAKGNGVGAIMNMQTQFNLAENGTGTTMRWEADVKIAGPVGAMGQRVLQPIINQQVGNVLGALEKQVERGGGGDGRRRAGHPPGSPEAYEADPDGPTHNTERVGAVAVPFRIGVMQLTMEPLDEMLESARVMDEAGMDTVWLAEAYPWWRKHQMEARGSTVVSALMARETERLTIGWGIISPFTRHPVQVAMDARVVQEAAGPGRFILGFGTSKIFLNNARMQTKKTLGPMRDAVEIVRGVLGGEAFSYEGDTWSRRRAGALGRGAHAA